MGLNKVSAVVILKEHSERVPGKNLKEFNGKPLFFYILDTLSRCSSVKEIFIDTASEKIIKLAKENFNVKIINRPPHLQDDLITANQLVEYDLNFVENEHLLYTHATNPLLTPETLETGIKKYFSNLKEGYDSLFSVERVQQRTYYSGEVPINHRNEVKLKRTQDLEPIFVENSSIFLFSKTTFNKYKSRIGKNPFLFEMNKYESIDIDEEPDFYAAKALLEGNKDGKIY